MFSFFGRSEKQINADFTQSWNAWWSYHYRYQYGRSNPSAGASDDARFDALRAMDKMFDRTQGAPSFFFTRLREEHFLAGSDARETILQKLRQQEQATPKLLHEHRRDVACEQQLIKAIFTKTFGQKIGNHALKNFEKFVCDVPDRDIKNFNAGMLRDVIFNDISLPKKYEPAAKNLLDYLSGIMRACQEKQSSGPLVKVDGSYLYSLRAAKMALKGLDKAAEEQIQDFMGQHTEALATLRPYLSRSFSTADAIDADIKGAIEEGVTLGDMGGLTGQSQQSPATHHAANVTHAASVTGHHR